MTRAHLERVDPEDSSGRLDLLDHLELGLLDLKDLKALKEFQENKEILEIQVSLKYSFSVRQHIFQLMFLWEREVCTVHTQTFCSVAVLVFHSNLPLCCFANC